MESHEEGAGSALAAPEPQAQPQVQHPASGSAAAADDNQSGGPGAPVAQLEQEHKAPEQQALTPGEEPQQAAAATATGKAEPEEQHAGLQQLAEAEPAAAEAAEHAASAHANAAGSEPAPPPAEREPAKQQAPEPEPEPEAVAAVAHTDSRASSAGKAAPAAAPASGRAASPTKPEPALEAKAAPAEADAQQAPAKVSSVKKETPVERLTTPTAMRSLKTLQQTQGNKAEWHIASGVVFKSKQLEPEALAAMVDRLCQTKKSDELLPKPHAVKLTYDAAGKEALVPVKEVTKEENIEYMSSLYERCKETRAKTQAELAEKYLQPLFRPIKASKPRTGAPSAGDKA